MIVPRIVAPRRLLWQSLLPVALLSTPAFSQGVSAGQPAPEPAGKVSKVDAFTLKQGVVRSSPAYLSIGDIRGESRDRGYEGQIGVLSWAWSAADAGATTPPAGPGTLRITKALDKSSPLLSRAASGKRRFETVTITLPPAATQGQMMVVTLENVFISSIAPATGGPRPMEVVSLNYERVR